MNDLEICRRIAEIESIKGLVTNSTTQTLVYEDSLGICSEARHYNPLKDDALCFRLMVKYEIDFEQVYTSDVGIVTGKHIPKES